MHESSWDDDAEVRPAQSREGDLRLFLLSGFWMLKKTGLGSPVRERKG